MDTAVREAEAPSPLQVWRTPEEVIEGARRALKVRNGDREQKKAHLLQWLYALLGHAAAVYDPVQGTVGSASTTWRTFVDLAFDLHGEVQDMCCWDDNREFETLQSELRVAGETALPEAVWAEFASQCDIDTGEDMGPLVLSDKKNSTGGNVAALSCPPPAEEQDGEDAPLMLANVSAPEAEKDVVAAAAKCLHAVAPKRAAKSSTGNLPAPSAVYQRVGQLKAPTPRRKLPEASPARGVAGDSPLVRAPVALAPERLMATPLQALPSERRAGAFAEHVRGEIPPMKLDFSKEDPIDFIRPTSASLLEDDVDEEYPDAADVEIC